MSFTSELKKELKKWVAEGLVSEKTAEVLTERYELNAPGPWYRRTAFIVYASVLLLVFAAVVLALSENWENIPRYGRMIIVLLPLLGAHALAFRVKDVNPSAFDLLEFFASLMIGANIFLQAQIFHIDSYYPDGFLWWAVGALPAALYFRSTVHTYLVSATGLTFLFLHWSNDHYSPFVPLFWGAAFYTFLKHRTFLMSALQVFWYYSVLLYFYEGAFETGDLPFFLLAATLLLYSSAASLSSRDEYRWLRRLSVLLEWVLLAPLYIMTFSEVDDVSSDADIFPYVPLLTIAAAAVFRYVSAGDENRKDVLERDLPVAVAVLFMVIVRLAGISEAMPFVVVANLLFLALGIYRVWAGVKHQGKYEFFSGVTMILLLALGKFLDLIDNYMLTAGLFLSAAAVIYTLYRFWSKRYEA